MTRRRRSGFTLFEVLLVIAILALLAAFVVPEFLNIQNQAEIDLAKTAVGRTGAIAKQLKFYRIAMGKYPEGEEGLRNLIERPEEDEDLEEGKSKWAGPYIEDAESLKDPWGNEYNYRFPGENNDEDSYDLWSWGPDGEDGTDDDIVNWKTDE